MKYLWPTRLVPLVVLLVLALFVSIQCSKRPGAEDKKIGVVEKGELVQRVTVAGTVVPNRRTVFTPPYNGYIKKIYVKVGDTVKKGAPVVSVVESLHAIAQDVYPIRAPFSGLVVQVPRSEGEYVKGGDQKGFMVWVDDLSKLFIEVDVPEIDVGKIKLGQEVVIKASGVLGVKYKGIIREISLAAKDKEGWRKQIEFPVRIEIINPDNNIKPGMSVVIDIIAAKKSNILTLRHEYIRREGMDYFVILEDGTKQKVEVGIQNEEAFEIRGGVAEGDRVRLTDFLSLLEG